MNVLLNLKKIKQKHTPAGATPTETVARLDRLVLQDENKMRTEILILPSGSENDAEVQSTL